MIQLIIMLKHAPIIRKHVLVLINHTAFSLGTSTDRNIRLIC